jgi:TonB-dependent receptor
MKRDQDSIRSAVTTGSVATAVAAILAVHSGQARAEEPQGTPAPAPVASSTPVALEEVIVTGYRKSLNAALDTKRDSIAAVDQIVAEDIAAFPELNLAESIQRIPGVSIARDAGEGRQITVRGLGPQFTRVRINGMEALTTIGTSDANGGTNRTRSFDFNVFASELFNSITIHKTSSADLDEGSLGATVDLRTGRPFDYNGLTAVVGGKAGYNDLSSKVNPRATALISDTWFDGKFGALLSGAFQKRAIVDDGPSTVRWMNGVNSDGTPSKSNDFLTAAAGYTGPALGNPNVPNGVPPGTLNAAFRPRFPRYEEYHTDEKRIGLTNSLQFKPFDNTQLTLDTLFAQLDGTREEAQLEAPIFSSNAVPGGINKVVVDQAQIDGQNNLVYGVFDKVSIRAEHRYDVLDTKFRQHVLSFEQGITEKLKFNAQAGYAKSEFVSPISTTLTWDNNNVNGYTYDFRNGMSQLPLLSYGTVNPADPASWTLSQIRLRPNGVNNTIGDYLANLEWTMNDAIKFKGGGEFKRYTNSTWNIRRDSETTIPAGIAALPTSSYNQLVSLSGLNAPTVQTWAVPSIAAAANVWHIYDQNVLPLDIAQALGNNFSVAEKDTAGFLKMEFTTDLFSLPLRGDVGVRYVHTLQSSTGYASGKAGVALETVEHSYNDVLPALNLVAEVTDTFLVRFAASKDMTRPDLGSLNPGASVSITGANKVISSGNPFLDPFRAKAYDLSFEWYFAKESLLSVGLFYKDIDSFVTSVKQTANFSANVSGLPNSVGITTCQLSGVLPANPTQAQIDGCLASWSINRPVNTPGGNLKGVEVNYQQPFSFLPKPFNNFGVVLNYTHVDSTVKYLNSNTNAFDIQDTLTGLSKNAANATLYYDNGVWSARVSEAYRSPYLTAVPGNNLNTVEGTGSTLNLDAAASWNVTDALQLTAEGLNLTNQFQYQWVGSPDNQRMNYYHQQGREYFVGFRYKFQ